MIIRLSRNSFLPKNSELVHPSHSRGRRRTYRGSLWGSHNSCNLAISAAAHARSYLPSSPCLRPLDPIYVPRKIGLPRWKGHSYMMFEKFWQFEGPTPL